MHRSWLWWVVWLRRLVVARRVAPHVVRLRNSMVLPNLLLHWLDRRAHRGTPRHLRRVRLLLLKLWWVLQHRWTHR